METKKKLVFVLLDGLGDVSCHQLNNLTPLQFSNHPTMNSITKSGVCGLMDPVEPGLACGSDTAHLSIFGYDPRVYYRGRGAFESLGVGLEMDPGDLAFKCNFSTLDDKNIVVNRRCDRNFEESGPILCDYLNNLKIPNFPEYQISVKYATEHRCGIRIRGPKLSDSISGTDPLKDNLPLRVSKPLDEQENSKMTSDLLNSLTKEITKKLTVHPINKKREEMNKSLANVVLFRGPGMRLRVDSFEKRTGLKTFMIAPTAIISGLGITIQLDIIKAQGATGDYHTNMESKGKVAAEHLMNEDENYDFGFVHIKATDDSSHDHLPKLKSELIEKADKMLRNLLETLYEDEKSKNHKTEYYVVVTGDHSTPANYGDHSCEPVPFAIGSVWNSICELNGNQNEKRDFIFGNDSIPMFSEIDCCDGSLGRFPGSEIITIIKHCLEK
ncbi:cofactor-independent phosphoglycerate mutase [Anaeramoeba ignava]|uniref:Cofactor-independent phosphoglycerate mutase n=1 Tax=Anaeramoeba ignava TaxID=1746090 RepID=A0A9Q0R5D1_ANAIG|nr:cofactor-independent phosphoglycerate mutase [Anaeramoeba ignava]